MEQKLTSNLGSSTGKLSSGDLSKALGPMPNVQLKSYEIENGQAKFMDFLYDLFDRDNARDGLRGTYTGIWDQFQKLQVLDPSLPETIRAKFIIDNHLNEVS